MEPSISDLIRLREQARAEKNYVLADSIREDLKARGYLVLNLPNNITRLVQGTQGRNYDSQGNLI